MEGSILIITVLQYGASGGVLLCSMRSSILKEPDASIFRVYSARFYLPSAFCYVVPVRRVHFFFLVVLL
jgi:hypothetical protein